MEFKFTPLKDFKWYREIDGEKVLIGHYIPGMSYNCTKEPVHDALRIQCEDWETKGMIKVIPLGPGQVFKRVNMLTEEA